MMSESKMTEWERWRNEKDDGKRKIMENIDNSHWHKSNWKPTCGKQQLCWGAQSIQDYKTIFGLLTNVCVMSGMKSMKHCSKNSMETPKKHLTQRNIAYIPLGAMVWRSRLDSGEEVKKSDKENEHSIIRDSNVGIGSRLQNALGKSKSTTQNSKACFSMWIFPIKIDLPMNY